jgi:hypothetical protein
VQLVKGRVKRNAEFIPLDQKVRKQVKVKKGQKFALVQFEGTREENAMADRLGRPRPMHTQWVNVKNLDGHGGL